MRPKALWIEDSARLELASLTGPVFFNATCHLTLAEDVTSGVERMLAEPFDVVVVDIRLPPGRDEQWAEHYRETGSSKVSAQLGLKLLRWILGADSSIHTSPPPEWARPQRFGVFTVETRREIQPDLDELGIGVYREKSADISDTTLDEIIRKLLVQCAEVR